MCIANYGNVTIGRQVVTVGMFFMTCDGNTLIEEQVCVSGKVHNNNRTTILKRYIPPGSTCVIVDEPNTKVLETVHEMPAPLKQLRVKGGNISSMCVSEQHV
jgi:hypothetical protein